MNIAKILEKAPVGTKLYSPLFGDILFLRVNYKNSGTYPIVCKIAESKETVSFTEEGKYNNRFPGECMLYPSIENRDWSTFTAKYGFKPFEQVLVRERTDCYWKCSFYSHSVKDGHVCIDGLWKYCIPFVGNENLLGSSDKPD